MKFKAALPIGDLDLFEGFFQPSTADETGVRPCIVLSEIDEDDVETLRQIEAAPSTEEVAEALATCLDPGRRSEPPTMAPPHKSEGDHG